jgi:hypothetical protein
VLRRHVGQVRYQSGDRLWLAALSKLVLRHRWSEVSAVTPATLLAWHRRLVARKWDYTSRRRPGRPSTTAAVVSMRFGLTEGQPKTLDEIGKAYGVTRERIRQIESQAMSKLRNPSRSHRRRDYLD